MGTSGALRARSLTCCGNASPKMKEFICLPKIGTDILLTGCSIFFKKKMGTAPETKMIKLLIKIQRFVINNLKQA